MGFIADIFGGGGSKPSAPPPPAPAAPVPNNSAAVKATNQKRAGLSQTVYSSPLGDSGQANVARKTLLGQ